MNSRLLFAAVLSAAAGVNAARADSTHYNFTYTGSGSGISAVGSLTLNGIGCATSGSITISGSAADGTYALANFNAPDGSVYFAQDTVSTGFYYDNNLYCEHVTDPEQHLSSFGLLFTAFPSSLFNININFNGTNYSMMSTFLTINDTGEFECYKVPAPGAIAMVGLVGLVGSRRRRA